MSTTQPLPNPLEVRDRLSPERLGPYLTDAVPAGDVSAALHLYAWNMELSSAFFELLGHVEVVMRNAMHTELTALSQAQFRSDNWFDQAGWFTPEANRDIADAKDRLNREGKPITPGRLVAELNFGFWRYLLGKHYDSVLWRFAFVRSFPHSGGRRANVYAVVEPMHRLRNRIAHHEPIHQRNHVDDHDNALQLVRWISADAQYWIEQHCRVHSVLAKKP